MSEYILQMNHISKSFSSHRVLNDIMFQVKAGEVHALCGENGAGKSTMMKILSGFYPYGAYEGEIMMEGKLRRFANPRESAEAGIEIIYQELEVANNMTVAENIFMGREPGTFGVVNQGEMIRDSRDILKRLKVDLNPAAKVESLGVGMKQMVVIARSLLKNPKVLIMDEPSAALSESETSILLSIIRDLRKMGVACVYISHRLNEVMEIADRITVIRDGECIITDHRESIDRDKLVQYMVGRKLSEQFEKKKVSIGDTILKVDHLNAVDERTGRQILEDVSFDVKKGEILGIAGLVGAGRTETAMAIMGVLGAKTSGNITLEGRPMNNKSPQKAIQSGVNIVAEDRKEMGLVLGIDVKNNIVMSSLNKVSRGGVINQNEVIKYVGEYFQSLNIKAESAEQQAGRLSGGNQQKVVLAKVLMTKPKVLILDEPTRGIDVGAKHEIYQIMEHLVAHGVSIIMISSELPEVLAMSDRVVVMSGGRVTGILKNVELSQETVMRYATEE